MTVRQNFAVIYEMKTKRCPKCGGRLELRDGVYSHHYSWGQIFGRKLLGKKICDYSEKLVKRKSKKLGKNVRQKMSIQIKKRSYRAKDGSIHEYFYKYGYWREGGRVKCRYLGRVKCRGSMKANEPEVG